MMEHKNKNGGARLQKKEPKQRTKKEKIRLGVILGLVLLLAVFLVLFAVYRAWATKPDLPSEKPNIQVGQQVVNKEEEIANGETDPGGDGVEPVSDRKNDFYTFLVVGRDTGGGGNTDTILLVAYDVPNQKLNVMSIPRDTMVNIPYDIKRINAVYNYSGGGEKGIHALYQEVSQLIGFIPDYEVVIEWNAIGELVEAIEGVWFDVPRNMDYDDPLQDLHIHIQAGYQLLNGEDAMGVIRWRMNNDGTGYITGDIGRIETQQAFLKTVVAQCLQVKNVTKIREFAEVFTNNVQTDLTLGNLVWFAEQAIFGGLSMENVNFITLPGDYNGVAWSRNYQNYQSYVLPNAQALLNTVNENFNPYSEERALNTLDIMSVNRDGSLSSTTGRVEDTIAAQPPVIPEPEPEPEPEPVIGENETPEPEPGGEFAEPESPGDEEGTAADENDLDPVPEQPVEEMPVTEEVPVLPPLSAAA